MRVFYRIVRDIAEILPFAEESEAVMQREDFHEYVSVHGFHFTCELADAVTKKMENNDSTSHNWTTAQVKSAMDSLNLNTSSTSLTAGDIAYLANMAYADFYPAICKTEQDCLRYAYWVAHDKDGYPEIAFMRWISDLIGKGEEIDWSQFA